MPKFIFATYQPQDTNNITEKAKKWIGKKIPIEKEMDVLVVNKDNPFKTQLYYKVDDNYKDNKLGYIPFSIIKIENVFLDPNNKEIPLVIRRSR